MDYDWFPFPTIDQEGTLFAGEIAVTFRNAPEVKDFLNKFISEDFQCAMGGVTAASSRISPERERRAGLLREPDPGRRLGDPHRGAAGGDRRVRRVGPDAGRGRFGSFWTGMVTYMQEGPDSIAGVLDDIEASWPTE